MRVGNKVPRLLRKVRKGCSSKPSVQRVLLDHQRRNRTSIPEVVFAPSKTFEQLESIMLELYDRAGFALASRVKPEFGCKLTGLLPNAFYHKDSGILRCGILPPTGRSVGVISAGTGDVQVAEEAAVTLESLGHDVVRRYDVGVAGIHRILTHFEQFDECTLFIVVAGMEGALPSVVAGLTPRPVIGVPVSVGYGVASGGYAALNAMLSSCAPGIAVVNIDNGFGAAAFAHKLLLAVEK